jgi:hypothetical protein
MGVGPSLPKAKRLKLWQSDDEEPEPLDASDPREASDRPPAVYYAPKGECAYCDRRRAAAARSMRATREREG